ncbi:MAG: hypothetical protein SX243_00140 [Acidobacteriota bacterium]|nr:hypothetical protein [Acidobacteriota bacterium]
MTKSLRAMLAGLIDYAGLFPPAQLPMQPSVDNYAAYRGGEDAWMLGRFVVPLARLEELEQAVEESSSADGEEPWPLSVLAPPDAAAAEALMRFDQRRDETGLTVSSLEIRVASPEEVERALQLMPEEWELFFEAAAGEEFQPIVEALAGTRGRAKIRTGGVTAEAFPRPAEVQAFFAACRAAGIPFKATAGLHHPICGRYRLTYEDDSPCATMYGFANLFLAAALLHAGTLAPEDVSRLLVECDSMAFCFDDEGAQWHDARITTAQLVEARQSFCRSYGSCSFTEPIDDLRGLTWL